MRSAIRCMLHSPSQLSNCRTRVTSTLLTPSRTRVTAMATSTETPTQPASDWAKEDKRRALHVVYRVGDLQKHIDFYTQLLGMKLLRNRDVPAEKYSNAFLGYGPEDTHFALELTYNYGVDSYDIGEGFGHFAVALQDVKAATEKIKAGGGKIIREAGPVKGGNTIIAFAQDPTGYQWELIQREKPSPEPLCQVMLRVSDLERSIAWYRDVLGMTLLRTRDNPDNKYTLAFMGYGPEDSSTVIELTYNYGRTEYAKGNAYAQVAISTRDVYKTAEQMRAAGGNITKEPTALPGIGTKICAVTDPDGWKYVMVDEEDFGKELQKS